MEIQQQAKRLGTKRVLAIAVGVVVVGTLVAGRISRPAMRLQGRTFSVEVADTVAERVQGLSGRQGIEASHAMLFVFDEPSQACFWMKDMRFNIDILWFDADRKLIHQERSLSPETYPRRYCPPRDAKYVVEVVAGTAEMLGLQDGSRMTLRNL